MQHWITLAAISFHGLTTLTDVEAKPEAGGVMDARATGGSELASGQKCPECGAYALHKRDGYQHCSSCGYIGNCG